MNLVDSCLSEPLVTTYSIIQTSPSDVKMHEREQAHGRVETFRSWPHKGPRRESNLVRNLVSCQQGEKENINSISLLNSRMIRRG